MRQTGKDTDKSRSTPEETPAPEETESLYFFPDQEVPESRVRHILDQGSDEDKAWVISHLLRFAQWDDIWTYVTRDQVREIFPLLDMPEKLQAAWARMLKVETPVA